ncbi:NAD(P)H-dependent oxidoreductase [Weissella diestrammenae]|uniref:NAD(P)H-dependent oxidoreductase n=1 Tax=Weissella diestrammenae TaxID=1162633 RepID=A0A7G9T5A3_9LACO|nr:NAD(P)H-dependent oxidoreductase [Weissella diestrammenae]MCM0583136.1 NAD(P)H-dependent oxidoreductase [Weissella diestrammenae]QNN75278.1 NAD(P)H-dependent oxidoreductase [Weissella diestrammenae]
MTNFQTVVLNASQNRIGHSTDFAKQILSGIEFSQINLVDYRVYPLGQSFQDDQLDEIVMQFKSINNLVITTPVYCSDMPGTLKTFIDRTVDKYREQFSQIKVTLLVQGNNPAAVISPITNVVANWAERTGMQFIGAVIPETTEQLQIKIKSELRQ